MLSSAFESLAAMVPINTKIQINIEDFSGHFHFRCNVVLNFERRIHIHRQTISCTIGRRIHRENKLDWNSDEDCSDYSHKIHIHTVLSVDVGFLLFDSLID